MSFIVIIAHSLLHFENLNDNQEVNAPLAIASRSSSGSNMGLGLKRTLRKYSGSCQSLNENLNGCVHFEIAGEKLPEMQTSDFDLSTASGLHSFFDQSILTGNTIVLTGSIYLYCRSVGHKYSKGCNSLIMQTGFMFLVSVGLLYGDIYRVDIFRSNLVSIVCVFISRFLPIPLSKDEQDKLLDSLRSECILKNDTILYPDGCPTIWDGILCWPNTPSNTLASLPCPEYFKGFPSHRNATKYCQSNGTWYFDYSLNQTWTDYTACMENDPEEDLLPPKSNIMYLEVQENRTPFTNSRLSKKGSLVVDKTENHSLVLIDDYITNLSVTALAGESKVAAIWRWSLEGGRQVEKFSDVLRDGVAKYLPTLKIISQIGYSVSLISLIFAFILLASFNHCDLWHFETKGDHNSKKRIEEKKSCNLIDHNDFRKRN
uniref:G_PROTEIN_RECEP_F2_3 domain-containing protein n=1 Tax=Rhodnius prolixus TaxID=13249 RepID=T1I464_RHOPR